MQGTGTYWGSINGADAYGIEAPMVMQADPFSGPLQSYVAPVNAGAASGGNGPAISLLGIALLLVVYRVAIELGSE